MKLIVAAFNQEKALVVAFSVIVQLRRLIVYSTTLNIPTQAWPRSGDSEHYVSPPCSQSRCYHITFNFSRRTTFVDCLADSDIFIIIGDSILYHSEIHNVIWTLHRVYSKYVDTCKR